MKRKRSHKPWRTSRDDFIIRSYGKGKKVNLVRGYDVRFPKTHGFPQKYFGMKQYGSERAALEAARAHRDQLVRASGEAPRRPGKVRRTASFTVVARRGNKSGIPGVAKSRGHWIAWYHPRPRVQKRRSFAVAKYTDQGARLLAIRWREEMIAKLRREA